jgi:DNA helicase HerA-like ATPase
VDTEAERLALTTRALAALWKAARDSYSATLRDADEPDHRVPTILVLDEAHNIIPVRRTSPAAERVAADVLRIAAEGRKFGLFLLVVTQRPRKLDPSILSECDALFLMKMTNDNDLKGAAEVFGFLEPTVVAEAKNLKVGDVFLQGRLGRTSAMWHAAPRRTRQGGKSLDDAYWSTPYPKIP